MTDTQTLEFVDPVVNAAGINILLYGPPGVGKTTAAGSAPGPIVYLNLEGQNAMQNLRRTYGDEKVKEVLYRGDKTITQLIKFINEHEQQIGTVVIDSVGELHRQLLLELVDANPKADSATLPMYGQANTRIERLTRWLLNKKPVVVLVCHEQVEPDMATGSLQRMPLTGGKQLPTLLSAMVDVVAHLGVKIDDGKETYYSSFRSDGYQYGKDRTGKLGVNRISDITRWLEVINAKPKEEAA